MDIKINVGDNVVNFADGWNCYGLTIKGPSFRIEKIIADEVFDGYNYKKDIVGDGISQVKIVGLKNRDAYISIEKAMTILLRYPVVKYATFWEGICENYDIPQLLVLYSESGSSAITKCKCITDTSREGEDNPLYRADLTNLLAKKFKYKVTDSRFGFFENNSLTYSFPFADDWNDEHYVTCLDNKIVDLEKEKRRYERLFNKFISDKEYCKQVNNDKELMLELAKLSKNYLGFVRLLSDNLKNDVDIILQALKYGYRSYISISDVVRNDEKFILGLADIGDPLPLYKLVPDVFRDDEIFMERAIKYNPIFIGVISDRLRNNSDFFLDVTKKYGKNQLFLREASVDLKSNRDFVLKMLECETADCMPNVLDDDADVILAFAKKKKIISISDRLRDDKDFILKLMEIRRDVLYKAASKRLRDDEDVILKSLKYKKDSLYYASERLKDDKEFVKKAMDVKDGVLQYASKRLRDDIDLAIYSIMKNPKNVKYISSRLKKDSRIIELIK